MLTDLLIIISSLVKTKFYLKLAAYRYFVKEKV